jgi:hypothetical protein
MAVEIGVDCWYDVHPDGETDNAGRCEWRRQPEHRRRAHEQAWEEGDLIGKRYLEGRFEQESGEAGFYVDPSVFEYADTQEGPYDGPCRHLAARLSSPSFSDWICRGW